MTPSPLKWNLGSRQWNLEITFNGGLHLPRLDPPQFQPNSHLKLHVDPVNPFFRLPIVAPPVAAVERNHALPPERRLQDGGVLVPLVEPPQILDRGEPAVPVERRGVDGVIVDADAPVRVPGGDGDGEVVVEGVVRRGEVEPGQGGVLDVEADLVRAEDEPEHEGGGAEEEDEGAEYLEEAVAGACEEAAEEVAAAAAPAAASAAGTAVGFRRRRGDGRAVVGSVQVSFRHGSTGNRTKRE